MECNQILYLSGEQVSALGAGDMRQALVDVEETL